jgi:4-hydroxy-tetrahydrodipicolinate synthase
MSKKISLKGTGVALVTPFHLNGKIDFGGLNKLVDHVIRGKCEYLVVLGTTGESVTLTTEEKKQVIQCVVARTKKRVPLVLGLGGNDTHEIIRQFSFFDFSPFSAILSVSPYYNKPSQEGIYQHYKLIARQSPLPIILYNVPGRTSSNILPETTLRLADEFDSIIGIKEASGNVEQCMKIIRSKRKDFLVISGDDNLTLPLIASGADGVISVAANALPKDFSNMVRFAMEGKMTAARKLHYKIMPVTDQLFADGNPGGIKFALSQLNICMPHLRLPLVPPNSSVQVHLKKLLESY